MEFKLKKEKVVKIPTDKEILEELVFCDNYDAAYRIKDLKKENVSLKRQVTKLKKYINKSNIHTPLTPKILQKLGFHDNGNCEFEFFQNMNYWVKNRVCLFYNRPFKKEDSFYVGYGNMRDGKYIAVGFKWIDSLEELTEIYEAITKLQVDHII